MAFFHPQCHDDAAFDPVIVDGATELSGDCPVQQLAPVTVCRSRRRGGLASVFAPDNFNLVFNDGAGDIEQPRIIGQGTVFQRIRRQFVDHEGQTGCGLLSQTHARNSDADATGKSADIVVRGEEHRKEVSEQRRPPLTIRQRADQFVCTAEGREPLSQLLRHFLFRLGGPRGDVCQSGRQSQNIFDAMAHLACQELMAFLRLLAARDVEEDPCHFFGCGISLVALTSGRNPTNVGSVRQNTEIDFKRPINRAGCDERRSDAVPVGGMDFCGKMLEGEVRLAGNVPEFVSLGIHYKRVVIDNPGPECHSGRPDGAPEFLCTPFGLRRSFAQFQMSPALYKNCSRSRTSWPAKRYQ
ncbi:Hypothetical protein AT6N2_L1227 [Agrobacterium tumefaciens]|nr:Hypothetical protein AT6N2_L1227 [Agrobacterium tumefaciens]